MIKNPKIKIGLVIFCLITYLYVLIDKFIIEDYSFDMVYFLIPIVILVLFNELNKVKLNKLIHQNNKLAMKKLKEE